MSPQALSTVNTDPPHSSLDPAGISRSPFRHPNLKSWKLEVSAADYWPAGFEASQAASPNEFPTSVLAQDNRIIVSFEGLARFEVSFELETILVFDITAEADEEAIRHLLFDQVAPRILAHQGALVLHASAVLIGSAVTIFLGETGAGKSTLAASLHKCGHHLLGDDAIIITRDGDRFMAEPVYPSLRLFPDSASALLDGDATVSAMAAYSDKQRVDFDDVPTTPDKPLPIAALFLLAGDPDAGEIAVRSPSPAQACITALEQSFALDPYDAERATQRLSLASDLIEGVDSFELDYPNGYDRLGEVHALIQRCISGEDPVHSGDV